MVPGRDRGHHPSAIANVQLVAGQQDVVQRIGGTRDALVAVAVDHRLGPHHQGAPMASKKISDLTKPVSTTKASDVKGGAKQNRRGGKRGR
jgi:hypothetical protein